MEIEEFVIEMMNSYAELYDGQKFCIIFMICMAVFCIIMGV